MNAEEAARAARDEARIAAMAAVANYERAYKVFMAHPAAKAGS